jgi:hypothetical protein
MYKSSIVIERIDYLLIEQSGGDSVFPQSEFMNMIAQSLTRPIEQIWRVRLHDDGTVGLFSFAMPRIEKNFGKQDRLNNASYLPDWVKERISVLQICESGAIVEGVGQKVSDKVFYVIE